DIDIMFEAGFSTKYDTTTGKMSTGIGLSHVKQIVENYYKGRIYVDNTIKDYTVFEIAIPIEQIETRK
ncbi:ATP-binding protein, partial [Romboutsia sp.]|uniref:ATP-binding protein n=1 Tax=Romboutsia sp. TaxID=1965302 RepID=UPI002CF73EFF